MNALRYNRGPALLPPRALACLAGILVLTLAAAGCSQQQEGTNRSHLKDEHIHVPINQVHGRNGINTGKTGYGLSFTTF